MKYINEQIIWDIISQAKQADSGEIFRILAKAASLQRLSLAETAVLLLTQDRQCQEQLLQTASTVKNSIYGKRVVLFAPLYISNVCANNCAYCAFKADNTAIVRKVLTRDEIQEQVRLLLSRGHKRVLMVAGEGAVQGNPIDFYVASLQAMYEVKVGPHALRRINVNCAPLSVDEFRRLKKAGIGTYQIFQETYHDATYRQVHPRGPKSDPDNRLSAVDRAFAAGIDDVGIGVLYGLFDPVFETLALLMHIEHLERMHGVGPHTISVPRIEPAEGVPFTVNVPYALRDELFKRIVAVLRLSVPYTGIILSTREQPQLRDELFSLGVSQISAASSTSPGGYTGADGQEKNGQFSVGDLRSLDEVIASLISQGFIPSFCAACYRSDRTGKKFMDLARPGTIKGQCSMNALITLKEYLDDFASLAVRQAGYKLIDTYRMSMDEQSCQQLCKFFTDVDQGVRDAFV